MIDMFDVASWVHSYGTIAGYLIISGIIFAETGLFFGFFFPGDSILFPAGILASQGYFNIYILCLLVFIAAVGGNTVGYLFGKHVGKRLFNREDSLFFHRDHIVRARNFYDKYGGKTIILARFLPVIRTFVPIVAGISEMNFYKFFLFSTTGALLWAVGLSVGGYFLGKTIPDIDKYLLPIIIFIISLSLLPPIIEAVKTKERRAKLISHVKKIRRTS